MRKPSSTNSSPTFSSRDDRVGLGPVTASPSDPDVRRHLSVRPAVDGAAATPARADLAELDSLHEPVAAVERKKRALAASMSSSLIPDGSPAYQCGLESLGSAISPCKVTMSANPIVGSRAMPISPRRELISTATPRRSQAASASLRPVSDGMSNEWPLASGCAQRVRLPTRQTGAAAAGVNPRDSSPSEVAHRAPCSVRDFGTSRLSARPSLARDARPVRSRR